MVTAASVEAEATAKATKLATKMSGIDKLISDMVAEEKVETKEENMAIVPDKGKKLLILFLGENGFDLRYLGG
jgi:uncharacterized ferredoxin-like protein